MAGRHGMAVCSMMKVKEEWKDKRTQLVCTYVILQSHHITRANSLPPFMLLLG